MNAHIEKDKESRILHAAIHLFAAQGPRKTTVDQIATAAGVGKGTVYLYFKSKNDILDALVRRETMRVFQQARSAVRRESTAPEQLRAYLSARVRSVAEFLVFYQIKQAFVEEARADVTVLEREMSLIECSILADILEAGIERGELVVNDVQLVCVAIATSLRSLEEPWWYEGRELSVERKINALVDLFINGLKKPPTIAVQP